MGNQQSNYSAKLVEGVEYLSLESFFILKENSYKITDVYNVTPGFNDIEETIQDVITFFNNLKLHIESKFKYPGANKVDPLHPYTKYLLNLMIIKKSPNITNNNTTRATNTTKNASVDTVANAAKAANTTKTSSFIQCEFPKKEEFIQTLSNFILKFSNILSQYSNINEFFKEDDNDNSDIQILKKNINDKIGTLSKNMKFFDFDFYVINYVEYVYMFYAIHTFDKISEIYKDLKETNDLKIIDTKIVIGPLQKSEVNFLQQIRNLIDILKKPVDLKSGGSTLVAPPLPNSPMNTPASQSQNVKKDPTQFPQKVKSIMNNYQNKQNMFLDIRTQLYTYLEQVNFIVNDNKHKLHDSYLRKFEAILTDPETLEKLHKIEQIYSKKNEFVDTDVNFTVPPDLAKDLKNKTKLNDISLKQMMSIKNKIDEITRTHDTNLSKLEKNTTIPPVPENQNPIPILGGFIKNISW